MDGEKFSVNKMIAVRICQYIFLGLVLLFGMSSTTIASMKEYESADAVLVHSKERVWNRYIKMKQNEALNNPRVIVVQKLYSKAFNNWRLA